MRRKEPMTKSHWSPQVLVGSQGLARGSPLLQCSARQVGRGTSCRAAEDLQANRGCHPQGACGTVFLCKPTFQLLPVSTAHLRNIHSHTGHRAPNCGRKGGCCCCTLPNCPTHIQAAASCASRCVLTYKPFRSDEGGCSWPRGPSLPTHTCTIQGLGFQRLSASS